MTKMFEAWTGPATNARRGGRVSPHESVVPAVGLAVAGGTSLGMWVGLCLALRWAAQAIF